MYCHNEQNETAQYFFSCICYLDISQIVIALFTIKEFYF